MEGLATSLRSWATEEMRFQSTAYSTGRLMPLPSKSEFEKLCQKPLEDVWKYVIKHVRSRQTVKEIKGNIELNKWLGVKKSDASISSGDDNQLQQERTELLQELASCESDIRQLQKEMGHLTSEIQRTEHACQVSRQRVQDIQRKTCILSVVSENSKETIARYAEYKHRVQQRVQDLVQIRNNKDREFIVRDVRDKSGGDLETKCCRDVRQTCQAIGDFLLRTLDGSLTNKASLQNAQHQLWERLEGLATSYTVEALVTSLTLNTQTTASDLRDETRKINIERDLEALNFSYEGASGHLEDLSAPASTHQRVAELLLAGSQQHVLRWFQEQEHLNQDWKLTSRLDQLLTQIRALVQSAMGNNTRNTQLANSYIDAQIHLAEERSLMSSLQAESQSLMARTEKARQDRKELHLKHAKIQEFSLSVEKKQETITCLARQNSTAPDKLSSQKKQIMNYIMSRGMNTHATEVGHLTDDLKGSLLSELVKFTSLEPSSFLTVLLNSNQRQCVVDLSIAASIQPLAAEKMQMLRDVFSHLELPHFKSVDSLFLHVLAVGEKTLTLQLGQDRREDGLKVALAASGTTDNIETFIANTKWSFADLCQRAEQFDQSQCFRLLPRLRTRLELLDQHLARLQQAKIAADIWWERPAQYTTPWVQTEGKTFDQWLQKWRLAVTQLNKRMMDDKKAAQRI